MSERLFGAHVRRREDPRLITGRGRYVADVALPGMLHVAVHRSVHAHARLVKIDAEAARRCPGVVHVLVPADVAALGRLPLLVPHASLLAPVCSEILPQEIVSYVGQPVALVVAESAAEAEDALAAFRVEYDALPAVASLDDALKPDGPRVHREGNVAARFTQRVGDPAGALARADVMVRERFTLHRGAGMALETRGISARWDAALGQMTVWSTTQSPQILRRLLARFLGLAEHAVRVVTQDIGGGFGPKGIVYSEDILIPFLARALDRPVRFIETRREHLLAVTQERDQWHEVELGLSREGQIVALRDAFVHDCGAFVSWGIIVPLITSVSVPGPYRVPNYEVTFTAVYTNKVPVTPVRGAGRPQAVFVMERMLTWRPSASSSIGWRYGSATSFSRTSSHMRWASSRATAARAATTAATILNACGGSSRQWAGTACARSKSGRALKGAGSVWDWRSSSKTPGSGRTKGFACASIRPARSSCSPAPRARVNRTRPPWRRSSPTGSRSRWNA